jgi:hypothetical protein
MAIRVKQPRAPAYAIYIAVDPSAVDIALAPDKATAVFAHWETVAAAVRRCVARTAVACSSGNALVLASENPRDAMSGTPLVAVSVPGRGGSGGGGGGTKRARAEEPDGDAEGEARLKRAFDMFDSGVRVVSNAAARSSQVVTREAADAAADASAAAAVQVDTVDDDDGGGDGGGNGENGGVDNSAKTACAPRDPESAVVEPAPVTAPQVATPPQSSPLHSSPPPPPDVASPRRRGNTPEATSARGSSARGSSPTRSPETPYMELCPLQQHVATLHGFASGSVALDRTEGRRGILDATARPSAFSASLPRAPGVTVSRDTVRTLRVLDQVDRKFIVGIAGGVVYVVDQHAADERIQLERLQAEVLDWSSAGEQRNPALETQTQETHETLETQTQETQMQARSQVPDLRVPRPETRGDHLAWSCVATRPAAPPLWIASVAEAELAVRFREALARWHYAVERVDDEPVDVPCVVVFFLIFKF